MLLWPLPVSHKGPETAACCTNRCTKTSRPCPMYPMVADNRTRNLLILRGPAVSNFLDTEEVRGSSPPGPTIILNHLAPSAKFRYSFLPVISYLCSGSSASAHDWEPVA